MQAAGEADELHLLGVEAEQLGNTGRELGDDVRVMPGVRVARVDGVRETCSRLQTRSAVRRVAEARELGEVCEVGVVRAHGALAGLLGEVEGLVGDGNDLQTARARAAGR